MDDQLKVIFPRQVSVYPGENIVIGGFAQPYEEVEITIIFPGQTPDSNAVKVNTEGEFSIILKIPSVPITDYSKVLISVNYKWIRAGYSYTYDIYNK